MSPWTVIGWILVVVLAIPIILILLKLVFMAAGRVGHHIAYWKTRNIAPVKGQLWMGRNERTIFVTEITEGGRVICKSGNSSFSHNQEEWKKYVRDRRLRKL
jgi:hypothetical protein